MTSNIYVRMKTRVLVGGGADSVFLLQKMVHLVVQPMIGGRGCMEVHVVAWATELLDLQF